MKKDDLTPYNARSENVVYAELAELCVSPGYAHAIAYFCWRDNVIRYDGEKLKSGDVEHMHSGERLLRTEISTLIGLMVRQQVKWDMPAPQALQGYIDRTEFLLQELHYALTKPWLDGWDVQSGKLPDCDPFSSAAALREPIFYGGESAYSFQYVDLARIKYSGDDAWLQSHIGFSVQEVCSVCEAVCELQNKLLADCANSLKELPPEQWTILPGFIVDHDAVARTVNLAAEKVQRILDAFCVAADDRNAAFSSLSAFNVTNAQPVLKVADERYLLFQQYSLVEALYESPFFWMVADKAYAPTALANRGRFTEGLAADRLAAVFGNDRVLRNVDIYYGKDRVAEADALVLYGDRAIVLQAKSKRLTIEARKGNDRQLKDDFKKAVQDACDQARVCAEALLGDGFTFRGPSGGDVALAAKPKAVYSICVVADHYPALAFQARQFLRFASTEVIQPPLVTDVFLLDVLAEMLSTPLHFINYLALRARFNDKLVVNQEFATLGYHLGHNLWLDAQYDMANLGDDFAVSLDVAMLARRRGLPGEKIPKGLLTRFSALSVGQIFREIETAATPELTGLGLLLLQLSSKTAKLLSEGIDRIAREARRDGKGHDFSIAVDDNRFGLTVHCNNLNDYEARERLSMHCQVRKYDTKAAAWYGLLLAPGSAQMRGVLVHEGPWRSDPAMDDVMTRWPKRPRVSAAQIATGLRKIGRNEPCPCGSGKKYKRCCIIRYD